MNNQEHHGPKTVAIFMDGNRRWARAHGKTTAEGHLAGKDTFKGFLEFYTELREKWGTENYIFYAFSTENWNRSAEEVASIMGIFQYAFDEFKASLPRITAAGIRIQFIGQRERLSPHIQELMRDIETATKDCRAGTIALAVSYGGHADILQAVNHAIAEGKHELTEEDVRSHLWTAALPDIDLMIRPGGEHRLSNFLTWQTAYSELAFTDTLWPDFGKEELERIFADYESRERRKGK